VKAAGQPEKRRGESLSVKANKSYQPAPSANVKSIMPAAKVNGGVKAAKA